MSETSQNKDIRNPVPLFRILILTAFLCAIFAEIFSDLSNWSCAVFVLQIIAVIATTRHISNARRIPLTVIDVAQIGSFVPLLACLSAISGMNSLRYTSRISAALFSVVPPVLAFLWRTREELHHPILIISSSIQLTVSVFASGVSYLHGIIAVLVNITVASYAIAVLCGAMYMMREKIPVNGLKWSALTFAIIFTLSSIAGYFTCFHFFLISTAAASTGTEQQESAKTTADSDGAVAQTMAARHEENGNITDTHKEDLLPAV